MIAALMMYSAAVSLLLAGAAAASERVFRLRRLQARYVWILAMLVSVALTAKRFMPNDSITERQTPERQTPERQTPERQSDVRRSAIANATPPNAPLQVAGHSVMQSSGVRNTSVRDSQLRDSQLRSTAIRRMAAHAIPTGNVVARSMMLPNVAVALDSRVEVVDGSPLTRYDRPLLILWGVLSALAFATIGGSILRLTRPKSRWHAATIHGVAVSLSHNVGPAVIGVLRQHIVLPAWVLTLHPAQQELVIIHEREHADARDPSLLFVAAIFVALMPWNAALWYMVQRLRFAIELDCDQRVLHKRPNTQEYGALLLDVSERTLGGSLPGVALAETPSLVERRIAAMTGRSRTRTRTPLVGAALCAAILTIAACVAPRPARVVRAPAPSVAAFRTSAQTRATGMAALPNANRVAAIEAPTTRGATQAALTQTATTQTAATQRPAAQVAATQTAITSTAVTHSPPLAATDILDQCPSHLSHHDSESSSGEDGRNFWTVSASNEGCQIEVKSEGKLTFNKTYTAIDQIAPSGFFDATARIRGEVTRLVVSSSVAGQLRYEFTRDGRVQDFANSGAQWLEQFLVALDRISAYAIDDRYPAMLAADGANGVLDEIARAHTDYAALRYLRRLTNDVNARAELDAQALRRVGKLVHALESDHVAAEIVLALAARYELSDPAARTSLLGASLSFTPDYERARTLLAIINNTQLDAGEIRAALESVVAMNSDHEKLRVVLALWELQSPPDGLQAAFATAAQSIRDSRQRTRALSVMGMR